MIPNPLILVSYIRLIWMQHLLMMMMMIMMIIIIIVIIIILLVVQVLSLLLLLLLLLSSLLSSFFCVSECFFNRCLAVWYPFCFSGQAVYPRSRPSNCPAVLLLSFIYLFILSTFTQSFLFYFFYPLSFTFSCRASRDR